MARLMSLSFGDSNLSLEHWQMIKEIERLRKERLKWANLYEGLNPELSYGFVVLILSADSGKWL